MTKKTQHFVADTSASADKHLLKTNISLNESILSGGTGDKNSACFKSIDLRDKTPPPHKERFHKGLKFYFDKLSDAIFAQGLKDNNNIFTIGTYEKIITNSHVVIAEAEEFAEGHDLALKKMLGLKRKEVIQTISSNNVEGTYHPDFLLMDYQRRRQESRLIYVFSITAIHNEKSYDIKTKDISVHGLKIILPNMAIALDDVFNISFNFFIQEQEEYKDNSNKRFFENVHYEAVNIEHLEGKTYVGLSQKNLNDFAKDHIKHFIHTNRLQFKIDPEDSLLSAQAKFIQHLYIYNLPSIPLFISKTDDTSQPYTVDYFIETRKNKALVETFCNKAIKHYEADLSSFMLPSRLVHFSSEFFMDRSRLLFTYWEDNQLYTICDFEFTDKSDICPVIEKVLQQEGKIFSIKTQHVIHPDADSLKQSIEYLHLKENLEKTQDLLDSVQFYHTQLNLTDITHLYTDSPFIAEELKDRNKEIKLKTEDSENKPSPHQIIVSRANEKVVMGTNEVIKTQRLNLAKPKKIILTAQEQRSNVRYIHTMPVIINTKKDEIYADSIDFSVEGMGVTFPFNSDYSLEKNDYIKITFPEFHEKIKNIDFTEIDFKITGIVHKNNLVVLGLVRLAGKKSDRVGEYFKNLINKNKTKLTICAKNSFDQIRMIIFQAYLGTKINSIPVIVGNDKQEGKYIKEVGLNEQASQLSRHFLLNIGQKSEQFDFKILTSKSRLKQLFNRTMRAGGNKNQSFVLFISRQINEVGEEYINSYTSYNLFSELEKEVRDEVSQRYQQLKLEADKEAATTIVSKDMVSNNVVTNSLVDTSESIQKDETEFEKQVSIKLNQRKEYFFDDLFKHHGACIHFSFVNGLVQDKDYINEVIHNVSILNRHAGSKLKSFIQDSFGYIELTDVTLAYQSLLPYLRDKPE